MTNADPFAHVNNKLKEGMQFIRGHVEEVSLEICVRQEYVEIILCSLEMSIAVCFHNFMLWNVRNVRHFCVKGVGVRGRERGRVKCYLHV